MDIKKGIVGGIVAGLVFAVFEMIYAAIAAGNFFGPLQMIASIPLQIPPPEIGLGSAIVVGLITHLILSTGFGVGVTFLVSSIEPLRSSRTTLLLATSAAGLALWLVNFYGLSYLLGTPWFATQTSALWQGFIAHTFFFGTALGVYLLSQESASQAVAAPQRG